MTVLDVTLPESPPLSQNADGVILVGGTRVTLDTVVSAYKRGANAQDVVRSYPSLTIKHVYAAINYYLWHQTEVEAYLHERETRAEQMRREIEAQRLHDDFRGRLLARKAQREQSE